MNPQPEELEDELAEALGSLDQAQSLLQALLRNPSKQLRNRERVQAALRQFVESEKEYDPEKAKPRKEAPRILSPEALSGILLTAL